MLHPYVERFRERATHFFPDNPFFRSRGFRKLTKAMSDDLPWQEDAFGRVISVNWDRVSGEARRFEIPEAVPHEFIYTQSNWLRRMRDLAKLSSVTTEMQMVELFFVMHRPLLRDHLMRLLKRYFRTRFFWFRGQRITDVKISHFPWWFEWHMVSYGFLLFLTAEGEELQNIDQTKILDLFYDWRCNVRHLALALLPGTNMHKAFYEHPLGDLQIVRFISAFL